jgi:hypothetical protein
MAMNMNFASIRPPSLVVLLLVAVSSAMLLQGCKGGRSNNGHHHSNSNNSGSTGSSSTTTVQQPPSAPQGLAVSSTTKTLHFNWSSMTNVDYYRLLENADGISGYTQKGANITATAFSFGVADHFFNWPNAKYMLEACNSKGCSQSSEITATSSMLTAIGYFKPDVTPANINNYFGMSVALSSDGTTLVVGVPYDDSSAIGINGDLTGAQITDSGAVYVYRKNGSAWQKEAYIKASNANANDGFGMHVALSSDGNTLAVGASGEASNAMGVNGDQTGNTAPYSGAAYVFKRSNSTWTQHAYIKASNTEAYDNFGVMLALSGDGNTLAVSAINEDSSATGIDGNQSNNSQASSGAVYVFRQINNAWSQQAYIKASNTDALDYFGNSIALSNDGNTLAISAYWEDSNAVGVNGVQTNTNADNSGAAYVFVCANNTWSQQAYIKAASARALAYFGTSLSMTADGNTLAISAFQESSNATGIDGDQGNTSAFGSGAAYVFTRNASVWSQQTYIKASNTEANDTFGYNIKISADGNTLAVGATEEDGSGTGLFANQADNSAAGAGAVYVYKRDVTSWQPGAYVKASNTDAGDRFGRVVALSADGNVLAVSAVNEASAATGINTEQTDNTLHDAGAVYLY